MPQISIGLPVYNGARYIREAIDALLNQTFSDFELIVSDNGSTDDTPAIMSQYARQDSRIRYIRNPDNRGAAWNYNTVFRLSTAPFFKWAAHDDVCAPEFLERCFRIMTTHADVSLCFPEAIIIDAASKPVSSYQNDLHLMQPKPQKRYQACILRKALKCNAVFGLIRSSMLEKTNLIDNYEGSDNILLAQLAFLGKLYEIPEPLFFRRAHPQSSLSANPDTADRYQWFDPDHQRLLIPRYWRWLLEYSRCLLGLVTDKKTRIHCWLSLLQWALIKRKHLRHEMPRLLEILVTRRKTRPGSRYS